MVQRGLYMAAIGFLLPGLEEGAVLGVGLWTIGIVGVPSPRNCILNVSGRGVHAWRPAVRVRGVAGIE